MSSEIIYWIIAIIAVLIVVKVLLHIGKKVLGSIISLVFGIYFLIKQVYPFLQEFLL